MRTLAALTEKPFDVLVIGAGIQGAGVALAAARCGLRTALIDQGDFGGGVSANSLKVIHGGLRYLQHLDLLRMRESIRARSELLRFAPHLVTPRPFLMPTSGCGVRGRLAMGAALALNDLISADRNRGLPAGGKIPRGRMLSPAECLARVPGLDDARLTGAALWWDAQAVDSERLVWACVRAAAEAGAVTANYVRAERLLRDGGRVAGVAALDVPGGESFEVRARMTIWAGGPGLSALAPELGAAVAGPWVRAFNLVTAKRWPSDTGAALEGRVAHHDPDAVVQRGKRNLFFAPWRGGTLVGTWYDAHPGEPGGCRLEEADVARAVAEAQAVYPAWGLRREDVCMAHVGLMPARGGAARIKDLRADPDAAPAKHTRITATWPGGLGGLVAVQAVKYTTGLVVGERVVARVMTSTAAERRGCSGTEMANPAQVQAWARARGLAVGDAVAAGLAQRHGGRFAEVLARASAGDVAPLGAGVDVCAAEVRHAVRCEQALKLADVALRRTGLGAFAPPARGVLEACADVMAGELAWDAARVALETADLRAYYQQRSIAAPF